MMMMYLFSFVETPRKSIIAESSAMINLRGVSTKLNKYDFYVVPREATDLLISVIRIVVYLIYTPNV